MNGKVWFGLGFVAGVGALAAVSQKYGAEHLRKLTAETQDLRRMIERTIPGCKVHSGRFRMRDNSESHWWIDCGAVNMEHMMRTVAAHRARARVIAGSNN